MRPLDHDAALVGLLMGGLCVGLADVGKLDLSLPVPALWVGLAAGALVVGAWCGTDRRSRARSSAVCLALALSLARLTSWYAQVRESFANIELALPAIAAILLAAIVESGMDRWSRPPDR